MNNKSKKLILSVVLIVMTMASNVLSQKTLSLSEIAYDLEEAVESQDIDKFIKHFSSSVLSSDPFWGAKPSPVTREKIRSAFGAMFESKKWKLDILTAAVDEKRQTIMIRGFSTDPEGIIGNFAIWFKLKDSKIVEQVDFIEYPIKSLKKAPRFKSFFKKQTKTQ